MSVPGRRDRLLTGPLALGLAAIALALEVSAMALLLANLSGGAPIEPSANLVAGFVLGITYPLVGGLLAARRPGNAIGWIFLAIALSQATNVFTNMYSILGLVIQPGSLPYADVTSWLAMWTWAPGFILLATFSVLLFPDGRLPSPGWRLVAVMAVTSLVLLMIPTAIVAWPHRGLDDVYAQAGIGFGPGSEWADLLRNVGFTIGLVAALASLASLVLRFRRSSAEDRRKLKLLTLAGIVLVAFLTISPNYSLGPIPDAIAALLISPLVPLATAIAVLRYHLYEIDRIISRTVSYGIVTGILALVFVGTVLVLQTVLASYFSGSSVAVAASTLVVATLFQPLRRRVQSVVDHRFNRSRYDAERTVAAFGARLRDEVDLGRVSEGLLVAVHSTVRPESASIWLRGRQV
jgi:hypothetical protein